MKYINKMMEGIVSLLFAIMIIVGTLQVTNRFFLNQSLSWSEEVQRYAFIWMVFIAIPIAYNRRAHLRVDSFVDLFPDAAQKLLRVLSNILWLLFGVGIAYLTINIMGIARMQQAPGLGISMAWVYAGLVVGGVYQVLCVLHNIFVPKDEEQVK